MITFDRKAGELHTNGALIAKDVWSGFGASHNDPSKEEDKDHGPLPAGLYRMDGLVLKHPNLGPYVIILTQIEGDTFGRSAFRIHGNNSTPDPWDASHGCVIAPLAIRERCWADPDKLLRVI